jgi:antitoxin ParD1/3/4
MLVDLPGDLTEFVQDTVGRGLYSNESELVGAALRLLQERERSAAAIRKAIQPAIDELDSGGGVVLNGDDELHRFFEDLIDRGNARLAAER